MPPVADSTLYWAVLTRTRGEVLAAEAPSPGLHLGVVGVPARFAAPDVETWLYDVIGVAHEAGSHAEPDSPVPPLLRHSLAGLLFSHAELWDPDGAAGPCSFAFAHTVREVGFGLVGDARVRLEVDGAIVEPRWIAVRDEAGREARAWTIGAGHSVLVTIDWDRPGEPEGGSGAEIEAVWSAASAQEAQDDVSAVTAGSPAAGDESVAAGDAGGETEQEPPASPEPDGEEATGAGSPEPEALATASPEDDVAPEGKPRDRSAFVRWLERMFGWFGGGRKRESTEAGPDAASAALSPLPVESEGVEAVAEGVEVPVMEAAPPLDDRSERALVDAVTPEAPPEPVRIPRLWEALPDRVPPTPEPPELTARAITWTAVPDPRAIELPRVTSAATTGGQSEAHVLREERPPEVAPPSHPPAPETQADVAVEPLPESEPDALEVSEATSAPAPSAVEEEMAPSIEAEEPPPAPPVTEPGFAPVEAAAPEMSVAHEIAEPPGMAPRAEAIAPATRAEPTTHAEPAEAPVPAAPVTPPVRPVRRLVLPQQRTWPTLAQMRSDPRPIWQRPWLWAIAVLLLFAGGWWIGNLQQNARRDARPGGFAAMVRALGLGGPRFTLDVTSHPPGAWIAVDGRAANARTPAVIDLPPGEHEVALSFADLGAARYTVRGLKGEHVPLEATLWGAIEIFSPNEVGLVSVTVDGVTRGTAPLRVDSLAPGVHDLRFSGAGMPEWGQTVDLRVGETRELLARAVASPASGVLQVQGTITDEQGAQPLKGAQVWIDGDPRGVTPLTLDLPRGPHSVRVEYKGQEAPIQVIDLPGGNQRFAVFEFGLDVEVPRLLVDVPVRLPRDRPSTISVSLQGAAAPEAREMWLHAQMPGGPWRRYPMTLIDSPNGRMGVTVFPLAAFDAQGRARYYLSAQYGQGEESFSEMRTALLDRSAAR